MISELEMCARQFDLGHVARDAIAPTGFADACCWLLWGVASGAFGIVESRVSSHWFMHVVTPDATDASVIRITFAVKDAIGLKPYVVDAAHSWQHHYVFDTAMAGRAKFLI